MNYHPFYISPKGGTIQCYEGDEGRLFRVCSSSKCLYCEDLHAAKSHLDYLENIKVFSSMMLPPSSPSQTDELWPYPPLALLIDCASKAEISGGSSNKSVDKNITESDRTSQESEPTWDAVETYFECISSCSLDDGECLTRCVEQLKEADK
jgi:hypothetical protein